MDSRYAQTASGGAVLIVVINAARNIAHHVAHYAGPRHAIC